SRQVDLLYHDATFTSEHQARAEETGHSTAGEAAEVARQARARRLLIGHISARHGDPAELLAEARAVFKNTEVAEELKRYALREPLPTPEPSARFWAAASPHTDDDRQSTDFDRRLLRRIIQYLEPYKWWVLLAFGLTVGAAYLGPLRPKLVQEAIDGYIVPGDLDGLRWMIMLLVAALVGEGVLSLVRGYLTQWIGQQAIYDLRTKVFRHIQRQSLRFFDRTPVGRLITRTTSDVEALSDVL